MANAQLFPISRVATGRYGLNTQNSAQLLDPQWATKADNMIFNANGVLTSRYGWGATLNATPMSGSPAVQSLFEYTPISGSNQVVSAGGNHLYSGTTTLTDITGALTPSASNWKFVNFNGNVYGLQSSHPLIFWNGTGNFATVTAANGSVPNGNELLSAFGRLWGSDSTGQILKYSLLLDATQWSTTGAGSVNLTSVWGTGNDTIVALAAFNSLLVVFGTRNIIVFQDGSGSPLGLDPTNIQVTDIIPGIGCMARDSVQNVNGDDLVFLSQFGLQSLKRVIIERSNAIRNISLNVRDDIIGAAITENVNNIKSTYNAAQGIYTLVFPGTLQFYIFDTKLTLPDGTWRVTKWNNLYPQSLYTLHDNTTFLAGFNGHLYSYGALSNVTQDFGGSYTASYDSSWFDLGEELNTRLKILKRLSCVFSAQNSGSSNLRWQFDFSGIWNSQSIQWSTTAPAQFNVAQFGVDGFGGGTAGDSLYVPASGKGQYIKIGTDVVINGNQFVIQQMEMYAKIGRVI